MTDWFIFYDQRSNFGASRCAHILTQESQWIMLRQMANAISKWVRTLTCASLAIKRANFLLPLVSQK